MWEALKNAVKEMASALWDMAPTLVTRVLLFLGIGFASYEFLLPELVAFIQQYLSGLSSDMVALLDALRIDDGLTLIFSALAARMGTKVAPIRLGATPP